MMRAHGKKARKLFWVGCSLFFAVQFAAWSLEKVMPIHVQKAAYCSEKDYHSLSTLETLLYGPLVCTIGTGGEISSQSSILTREDWTACKGLAGVDRSHGLQEQIKLYDSAFFSLLIVIALIVLATQKVLTLERRTTRVSLSILLVLLAAPTWMAISKFILPEDESCLGCGGKKMLEINALCHEG